MIASDKIIAIVDDNLEDRHIYDRYLHQDKINTYKIIEAETGEEGIALFTSQQPDLILLDFNLPDMDGLEFIIKLKAISNCLPPIIMLTGEGNEDLAVKAMKAGVKDYLNKGKTNADNLCFAVRNVLEQNRLQQLVQRNEHLFRVSVENMLNCFGSYTSIRDENAQIIGFRSSYLNESAGQNNVFSGQEQTELDTCLSHTFDSHADLFSLCCEVVETGKAISTKYSLHLKSSQQAAKITKSFEIRINKLEDGFVAIWQDITERIQIEQALEESESKFRTLVTQAPVGIFQTDCQGDCLYVNPRWLEITGLSLAESMGKGWSNALHPGDKVRVYQEWYQAAAREQEFASEYRFCNSDGQVTWVSGTAVCLYNEHRECIGYFGTIIDITERKQAETLSQQQQEQLIQINQDLEQTTTLLQRRNLELDEFAHIVSHDLKAPLRAIRNLAEWIEEDIEDRLDDDSKQNFELLKNRVNRMQRFIESLLRYSRIGREKSRPEIFSVKDLLVDIIDSLAPPATFEIAIDECMPILKTQKIALEQVFTNLLSNAIKHHPSPTGKIVISAIEDQKFYYFSVADDGEGIAPKYKERIFGIFQTLSGHKNHENTGIGLSIVKKIVDRQGGKIELESQVGKGSTFHFSWQK